MSANLWKAVKNLADIWRMSELVQRYSAIAPGWRAEAAIPSAAHIEAQPFFLHRYIHTRVSFDNLHAPPADPPWKGDGEKLAVPYYLLIEMLRSRCAGYPFDEAPHLSRNSPWVTFNVLMNVPWLDDFKDWNIHQLRTAPVFPELGIDTEIQYPATTQLVHAFAASEPVARLNAARQALSEADLAQLINARSALDHACYPERIGQTHGNEDFRWANWAESQLDTTLRLLSGPARRFADALTKVDAFIQHVSALFSHLVFYKEIRTLDNIVLVEQLNGRHGWHTVRSDQFLYMPVRQLEVIAFDHPYPRGLMVVEGITERLSSGGRGSVTVHGYLLPESENAELPIRPPSL